MKFRSKVGERGQVVIPKPIRDNLGLGKNSSIEFELKGTNVTMRAEKDLSKLDLSIRKYGGTLRKQLLADGYKSVDDYIAESRGR
ncbi:MAG TPA: AbrB/MazE/SpoVT family DNA-binding domain-containing protein [Acidobacteriaceae bacterium]|nr:AbrB/MazE/SpoVT family DNA-binding domain-containing protein [Acidobacteriaceae bacterium]